MKFKFIYTIIVIYFFILLSISAQNNLEKIKCDTSYIKSFYDKLGLQIYISSKNHGFSIIDTNLFVKYKGAEEANVGLWADYKWFGIGGSVKVLRSIKNQFALNIGGNIYTRKFLFGIHYQQYKGFVANIKNNQNIDYVNIDFLSGDKITSNNFAIQSYYFLNNKKLSSSAVFSQTSKQKKSAGSLVIGISASSFSFYLPRLDTLADGFRRWQSIFSTALSIGYTYTYVWKKNYFASACIVPGFSFYQNINDSYISQGINTKGNIKFLTKISAGYDNEKYFIALQYNNDNYFARKDNYRIRWHFGNIYLLIGKRFGKKIIK